MKFIYFWAAAALLYQSAAASSDDKKSKPLKPCTVRSALDRFFDLNPLNRKTSSSDKKADKDETPHSWEAWGYDYPMNFTLNFCGPVVEELKDVVGVEERLWKNISAFYRLDGKTYSLGLQSSEPVFRGRKLVLNYTDGSPCSPDAGKRSVDIRDDGERRNPDPRRKSTIISLLCEKDPLAELARVAFVGASLDYCTYFFEVRTSAACGTIEKETQQVGPGGVFGIIALIAVLAYLIGGCVYQRTVMHQRGWRQLPNYSFWAGIWDFILYMFLAATSSCTWCLPGRRGYSRVSLNGNGHARSNHSDDENRLIDQLDEEWDD